MSLDALLKYTEPDNTAAQKQKGGALDDLLAATDPGVDDKQSDWKDAGDTVARGALDQGAGGIAEGTLRATPSLLGRILEGIPGTEEAEQRHDVDMRYRMANEAERQKAQDAAQKLTEAKKAEAELNRYEGTESNLATVTQPAAQKVAEFRQAVRDVYPVDKDFEQSFGGKVLSGAGQMPANVAAMLTGVGVPAAFAQVFDAGYQDAKANGADDATALTAGVANMPAGALDYIAQKTALGPLLQKFKGAAPEVQSALAQKLMGFLKGSAKATGTGAATGAGQQMIQNAVAQNLYDEKRRLTDNVGEMALVQGVTSGVVHGSSEAITHGINRLSRPDTGATVPESRETLRAQQKALVEGRQKAQMFPDGKGELPLPEGFERVETPRGVFHFDPNQITAEEIRKASASGSENEVLGLGPANKAEIAKRAAAGEPVHAVVERTPEGAEVKAAVVTPSTADATRAEMEARKAPENTVAAEPAQQTIIDRLKAQDEARATADREARAKEEAARKARQDEAAAKRARFDEIIKVANDVAGDDNRTFAQVKGALDGARFYAEDNSIGLNQEQREQAARASYKLQKIHDAMLPAENARQERIAAARLDMEAQAAAEQRARIEADKAAVKAAERNGIGADGNIDYAKLNNDKLAELAQKGDKRADKEMDRRVMMGDQEQSESLLEALQKTKLPYNSKTLGAELKQLLFQDMDTGQRKRYASPSKGLSLDQLAEALRGRGFEDIQTPDDVITFTQRALRGEDIRARQAAEQVEFAAAKRAVPSSAVNEQTLEKSVTVVSEDGLTLKQSVGNRIQNEDTGSAISIPNTAWKKSIAQAKSPGMQAATRNVPELVRTMRLVTSEADNAGRQNIRAIHRFVGAVDAEGSTLPVRVTVREMADGSMQLRHIEPAQKSVFSRDAQMVESGQPKSLITEHSLPTDRPGTDPVVPASKQRAVKVRDLLGDVNDGRVSFASGEQARAVGTETLARWEKDIRARFPALFRAIDLKIGLIEEELRARGYKGAVPEEVRGARLRARSERDFIVLAAKALESPRHATELFVHELAHVFWDTLPKETQDILREMHRREMDTKTGPLWKGGELQSRLRYIESDVKEWFAERVARLNEDWAQRSIGGGGMMGNIAYQIREYVRKVWQKITGDADASLFEKKFRDFWIGGADARIGHAAGAEFAEAKRVDFATGKDDGLKILYEAAAQRFDEHSARIDEIKRKIETLKESQEPTAEAAGKALRDQLRKAEADTRNAADEVRAIRAKLDAENPIKPKLPPGKTADDVIAEAARVEALPPVDRKQALIDELTRGRKLRDEGAKYGNETAETEGLRLVKKATERLDEEYPGWEKTTEKQTPAPSAEGDRNARSRFNRLYGQSAYEPTLLEKSWDKTRKLLRGFAGSTPELPTFAYTERAAKADPFIRKNGGSFYNNLREGIRLLRSSNDYVQTQAEQAVAAVVKPLLRLGDGFSADEYARLQKRQAQARKLATEGKPLPRAAAAELDALQSKLESSPYVLFGKTVLMLDMNWRAQNLKDSAGNPIKLPMGITPEDVTNELGRLAARIATSPHRAAIEAAIEKHIALVKSVSDELKRRELMDGSELANPYYFPHLTLQKTEGGKTTEREFRVGRVKIDTQADFRGYLVDPVGSDKPIETDYVKAMYYHIVQVEGHNLHADVVRDHFKRYDVMKEVAKRAKALSEERGVPVSWEQTFAEEYAPQGYVLFEADERSVKPALSVDRHVLAERLGVLLTGDDLHKQFEELGVKGIKLLPGDISNALAAGSPERWIVPSRVAEALRRTADEINRKDSGFDKTARRIQGVWKGWKLFMPWNHLRYEYGNMAADTEKLFSADPDTLKRLPESAREIVAFFGGKTKGSPDLKEAIRLGVINSITAQEMHQIPALREFSELQTTGARVMSEVAHRATTFLLQPITVPLGVGHLSSVQISAMREAVFRYAKFKSDLEKMRAGARPAYAGAYWKDIEAITDSHAGANDAMQRRAAEISLKTFGDYGDTSVNGRFLREKLIPFYSWLEVNFKYHANLFRNLKDMTLAGEMAKAEALKKGALAAAGFSARTAAGVALRLAIPYAAVAIWNSQTGLEDTLSEDDQRKFHIILGKDAAGKTMVITAPTAFVDVMSWISGPEFARQMGEWMQGRTDFSTAMSSWASQIAPDLANKTIGQMGPLMRIPYTLMAKRNPFPDITDQRTVPAYDMKRTVLSQATDDFVADLVMRAADKDYLAPKDMSTWAQQLILQIRRRDPEQWAFYEIKDKAASFVEDRTGKSRESNYDAPDQQVLRNFRRSIYRGDMENALRFYDRLLALGYTSERFKASIRAQDPLAEVPNGMRKEFVDGLSDFEKEELRRAYAYYTRMSDQRGTETLLFPSEKVPDQYRNRFTPNQSVLRNQIDHRANESEAEILRRGHDDMRRALILSKKR